MRSCSSLGLRNAERIGFAVEVQTGHLGELHTRVEALGIRLTGEHLDVVTEVDETATQVADIHPLAAAMGLAAIGEQGDAHGQIIPSRVDIGVLDMCPDYSLTG